LVFGDLFVAAAVLMSEERLYIPASPTWEITKEQATLKEKATP
jgi:hypothetical protein